MGVMLRAIMKKSIQMSVRKIAAIGMTNHMTKETIIIRPPTTPSTHLSIL